jgi:hypothetical protein
MNTDFDGDQLTVSLPLTDAAQREAGERLSFAAQLARAPGLLETIGLHAGLWGLAWLSLTPEGRQRLTDLAGSDLAGPDGYLTKESLTGGMRAILENEGAERALAALDALARLGFAAAGASGASIGPFAGDGFPLPNPPAAADPDAWSAYADEFAERFLSRSDFADLDLGPLLLAVKCRARGSVQQVQRLIGPWAVMQSDRFAVVRHGYRDGLTADEVRAVAPGHWEGILRVNREWREWEASRPAAALPQGYGVLARARRARRPGIVFARAAAAGERDALTDPDSRLFVGL